MPPRYSIEGPFSPHEWGEVKYEWDADRPSCGVCDRPQAKVYFFNDDPVCLKCQNWAGAEYNKAWRRTRIHPKNQLKHLLRELEGWHTLAEQVRTGELLKEAKRVSGLTGYALAQYFWNNRDQVEQSYRAGVAQS